MRTVHLGVLRLLLHVPGAGSLKDRRRAVVSLRDRVRHRFDVTWNEVDDVDQASSRVVVCTTAGSEARAVRSALDRVGSFVAQSGQVQVVHVDLDVFPWHPPEVPAVALREVDDG
jgi:uncharacterized protein YlxP (DUF503 family)